MGGGSQKGKNSKAKRHLKQKLANFCQLLVRIKRGGVAKREKNNA